MQCSPLLVQAQRVEAAAFSLAGAVRDPGSIVADEVLPVFEVLDRIGRAVGAAKLLLTKRIDESGAAGEQGAASTADLLSQLTGTSVGAAKSDLEAAKALEDLDETKDAMLNGEVSPEQAKVIAGAAKANPTAQKRLLKKAKTGSHRQLREEAQKVRAENDDNPEAAHRRIHAKRNLSMWVDAEGVWHLSAQGTKTDGALIQKAIERETDRVFRQHASATNREPRGAYAFDALNGVATRPGGTEAKPGRQPAPEHLALLRLDLSALKRGLVEEGELCEIVGVGPIPVSVAKALLGDAVLKLVITDGVDVLNVTSLTRGPTQAMKYAMLWTSPTCCVAGCDRTICEYDHITGAEYADTRHTRYDELDHPCTVHHDLHTRQGWALVNGTGPRAMVPPGHPDHPTRPGQPGDPPLHPMTDAEAAQLQANIARAKATFDQRVYGRQPPDPAGGPTPPEPSAPAPSLFG